MSAYPEQTPSNQPFFGAASVLKRELSANIEKFFYRFEHEDRLKTSMSQLLHLYEASILNQSREIAGQPHQHVQQLMQACTDYANGHGKIETVYKNLEILRKDLRG